MSAHVYDHNYCTLCTIFTYELKSKDDASQTVVQEKMLQIAAHHKVIDINIIGFMVDNAQARWNVVCDVFYDGISKPSKDWMPLTSISLSFDT